MKDFEVSAEPVQDWLSKTEKLVQESSNRLYDLPAKRREQQKLQVMRPCALLATLYPHPLAQPCIQPYPGVRSCCLEMQHALSLFLTDFMFAGFPLRCGLFPSHSPSHSPSHLSPGNSTAFGAHQLLAMFISTFFGPKLCPRCAFLQPLTGNLLVLFSLSLRK